MSNVTYDFLGLLHPRRDFSTYGGDAWQSRGLDTVSVTDSISNAPSTDGCTVLIKQ